MTSYIFADMASVRNSMQGSLSKLVANKPHPDAVVLLVSAPRATGSGARRLTLQGSEAGTADYTEKIGDLARQGMQNLKGGTDCGHTDFETRDCKVLARAPGQVQDTQRGDQLVCIARLHPTQPAV